MWLMFTTVAGFMAIMLIAMVFVIHYLKKSMIAEDSVIIDDKPEVTYDLNS